MAQPLLLMFLTFLLIPISHCAPVELNKPETANFESKLESAETPEFRLLRLLAHPDHTILPLDQSFSNKTALILAIGDFVNAEASQDKKDAFDTMNGQLAKKWVERGGKANQMANIIEAMKGTMDHAKIEQGDRIRVTLMGLYALGDWLLDNIIGKINGNGKAVEEDKTLASGLKQAFGKVERVLAGLDPSAMTIVANAELLDQVAGIGNKMGQYAGEDEEKKENGEEEEKESTQFTALLEGKEKHKVETFLAKLIAKSVDQRMTEVAGVEGNWGYVKKDDEDEDEEEEDKELKDEKEDEDEDKDNEEEQKEMEDAEKEEDEEKNKNEEEAAGNKEEEEDDETTANDKEDGANDEEDDKDEEEEKEDDGNEVDDDNDNAKDGDDAGKHSAKGTDKKVDNDGTNAKADSDEVEEKKKHPSSAAKNNNNV